MSVRDRLTKLLRRLDGFRERTQRDHDPAETDSSEQVFPFYDETKPDIPDYHLTREFIEDISSGCCPRGHYCTLKEILVRVPRDARTLMQIKCIEKIKYERSVRESRGVDWDEALDIWIEEGFAERFAELYRDGKRLNELYHDVIGIT